jgi:hypothetical protein
MEIKEVHGVTLQDWIAALRSGEYEQGKSALTPDKGKTFCCIGVLGCLVNGEKSFRGAYGVEFQAPKDYLRDQVKFSHGQEGYDYAIMLLPDNLAMPTRYEVQRMNDEGRTFLEIADYLESLIK